MPDREKVIRALELCRYDPDPGQEKKWDHSCLKCPYCTDFTGIGMDCTRMYTDAIALLKKQEEEQKRLVSWLGKFCSHVDQHFHPLPDEQNIEFFRQKMKQQFGWEVSGDADNANR